MSNRIAQAIYDALHAAGYRPTVETLIPTGEPRYLINGRPVSDFYSPDPMLNGNRDNYDTALGYLARVNPEALRLIPDYTADTQRDGFWLSHRTRAQGLAPFKVRAPKVLVEEGIEYVNAYPVGVLRMRFGS
jgi:hypothetical protein